MHSPVDIAGLFASIISNSLFNTLFGISMLAKNKHIHLMHVKEKPFVDLR